jgi:peroxiredoxin
MPQIVATHEKFKAQGLETLAVAMQYDVPAYVMQFAQSRQLPFRVAMDHTGEIAQGFGPVQLTPTTFVINKKGQIVKRYIGEPDFAAMHELIGKLLADQA